MKDLSWFKPWMPLAHVPFAVRNVGSRLHAVDDVSYLVTVPYNRIREEDDFSPYVTYVLFAPTDGAAERCANGNASADTLEALNAAELGCLGVADWCYEALSQFAGCSEAAEYDSRGNFLHVRLEWKNPGTGERIKAYFRERALKSTHFPYAVKYLGVNALVTQ